MMLDNNQGLLGGGGGREEAVRKHPKLLAFIGFQ